MNMHDLLLMHIHEMLIQYILLHHIIGNLFLLTRKINSDPADTAYHVVNGVQLHRKIMQSHQAQQITIFK